MTLAQGISIPSGDLSLSVIRGNGVKVPAHGPGLGRELSLSEMVRHGFPQKGLPDVVNEWRERNVPNLLRGRRMVAARAAARRLGLPYLWSQLWLRVVRADGSIEDLGFAGYRVVTTAGAGFIVDAFQDTVELENMKFHGIGTGNTAESASDTDLETEITTQYETDNTRPTGTTTEGASANIYRTVATITVDGSVAATEHGVLSDASVGSGVLLDRTVFAVVNLAASDSLQASYELTFPAGS